MRSFVLSIFMGALLFSCESTSNKVTPSRPAHRSFFYTYDTIPKIYQYRDQVNGMYEQFHRVYGIRDGYGRHIIVERYTQEGRLTEAYNFNLDSLNVIDHMVVDVNGEKEKALVYKNKLFPLNDTTVTHFASKFSGIADSQVILYERFREVSAFEKRTILDKEQDCMKLNESIRVTNVDIESQMENELSNELVSYFGKDIGLVEWHDAKFSQHFVLEKIISQKSWINLISG